MTLSLSGGAKSGKSKEQGARHGESVHWRTRRWKLGWLEQVAATFRRTAMAGTFIFNFFGPSGSARWQKRRGRERSTGGLSDIWKRRRWKSWCERASGVFSLMIALTQ